MGGIDLQAFQPPLPGQLLQPLVQRAGDPLALEIGMGIEPVDITAGLQRREAGDAAVDFGNERRAGLEAGLPALV